MWLNPAGPAASSDASVYLELVVRQPGATGRLGQISAGFNSRGLSFGYQRDNLDEVVGHTYRVGFGSRAGGLAAGAVVAFYRGNASAHGWDLGFRYAPSPHLALGAVVANLGEPEVRGVQQPRTYLPGATLTPFGRAVEASAHARLTDDGVLGYAFGLQLKVSTMAALVRLDTDRRLRRASFAFGLVIGLRDALGAVVTTSGDGRDVDAASIYGLTARPLTR